jgi:hypothetical protein
MARHETIHHEETHNICNIGGEVSVCISARPKQIQDMQQNIMTNLTNFTTLRREIFAAQAGP